MGLQLSLKRSLSKVQSVLFDENVESKIDEIDDMFDEENGGPSNQSGSFAPFMPPYMDRDTSV